jgi:hypothetical protein
MTDKIQIDNFMLSIEKKILNDLQIVFRFPNNTIYLNNAVEIKCYAQKKYLSIRNFLIEKWDYEEELIEQRERETCKNETKIMRLKNLFEFPFIFFSLLFIITVSIGQSTISRANLIFLIICLLYLLITIFESIYLFTKKEKIALLSINLRVVLQFWFFITIFVLISFLVILSYQ